MDYNVSLCVIFMNRDVIALKYWQDFFLFLEVLTFQIACFKNNKTGPMYTRQRVIPSGEAYDITAEATTLKLF